MNIESMVRPGFPIKTLSFWEGFDLFGSLRSAPLPYPHDDEAAIARDWAVVGQDLQKAIERFAASK